MNTNQITIPRAFVSTFAEGSWSKRIRTILSLPFALIGMTGILIAAFIAGED